jgi:hypothetical protein
MGVPGSGRAERRYPGSGVEVDLRFPLRELGRK